MELYNQLTVASHRAPLLMNGVRLPNARAFANKCASSLIGQTELPAVSALVRSADMG